MCVIVGWVLLLPIYLSWVRELLGTRDAQLETIGERRTLTIWKHLTRFCERQWGRPGFGTSRGHTQGQSLDICPPQVPQCPVQSQM